MRRRSFAGLAQRTFNFKAKLNDPEARLRTSDHPSPGQDLDYTSTLPFAIHVRLPDGQLLWSR